MSLENLLYVFLIAASPVVELRAALPLAINLLHIPWPLAFLVAFTGNMLPVPFLLLFLDPLTKALSRIKVFERMLGWIFKRTRQRGRIIERYETIGLVLFVAIPLPGTGVWTASIAAFLLGLSFKRSFLSILLGVFIAGVIVTALCLLGWLGAIIAGIGLAVLASLGLWRI